MRSTLKLEKLHYQIHYRWLYHGLLNAAIFFEILTLIIAAAFFFQDHPNLATTIITLGSLGSFFIFLNAWIVFRPLAFSFVEIFSDRIIFNRLNKILELKMETITAVHFSASANSFTVISAHQKPYESTMRLEKSELILEAIAAFNRILVDQKKLIQYQQKARDSDQFSSRVRQRLQLWVQLTLKYLMFPLGISGINFLISQPQTFERWVVIAKFLWSVNFTIGCSFYALEKLQARHLSQPEFKEYLHRRMQKIHGVIVLLLYGTVLRFQISSLHELCLLLGVKESTWSAFRSLLHSLPRIF